MINQCYHYDAIVSLLKYFKTVSTIK